MKFTIEIEISEEQIYDLIQNQLTGGALSVKPIINKVVKEKLKSILASEEFQNQITRKVESATQREIDKAVNRKVPGWVKSQVKLMLKFARARFLSEEVINE